ncbi:MAG: hypothetical protein PHS96_07795 [Anaerolineales bacterium]|nr:hypothetical protein [Anaerolineales bacterium]
MNLKISISMTSLLLLALVLSACNVGVFVSPSAMPSPSSTATPSPSLTFTPTSTPTEIPTETPIPSPTLTPTIEQTLTDTPIPEPVTFSGAVLISGEPPKPYLSTIEIRTLETFNLVKKGSTDSKGNFKITDVPPGVYDLWVLVTTQTEMVTGCSDVAPPNPQWLTGIQFPGDKGLTMKTASLGKALMLAKAMTSPDLKAQGIYFILPNFRIEPGGDTTIEVVLNCE